MLHRAKSPAEASATPQHVAPRNNDVLHADLHRLVVPRTESPNEAKPPRSLAQCKTPDVEHGVPSRPAPRRIEPSAPAQSCTVQDSRRGAGCATSIGATTKGSQLPVRPCTVQDSEHGVPRRSAPLRKEAKPPRGLALCKTRNTACHADRRRYERKPTSREVLHCARLGTGCATPIGAATKGSQLPAWSCTVQDARQFTRSSSAATSFSTWAYVN